MAEQVTFGRNRTTEGVTFGRNRKLQLTTCFAVDKNRKLMMLQDYKDNQGDEDGEMEGHVDVVSLDMQKPLVEQWENLEVKPDLVVSKLHKALGSRGEAVHDRCLKNYDDLMEKYKPQFDALNLIPIECENTLVDRYNMAAFLRRVSRTVSIVNTNAPIKCSTPRWLDFTRDKLAHLDRVDVARELPPYPIVAKPKSTAVKKMALVFNDAQLRHFCESTECSDFSLEQYVPHNDIVYKVYVIAQHIFIGARPSLPNVEASDPESLRRAAESIQGEYVEVGTDEGGYIVFFSNVITNRAGAIECVRLADYTDPLKNGGQCALDFATVSIFKLAIELEWNIELFGFDVLVDKDTRTHYVVDANVLPGFKGVPRFLFHMNKLFIRHGIRKGLREDITKLNSNEDALKSYCIAKLSPWTDGSVDPSDLVVRRLVDSRIFQVKFKKNVRPDVDMRKALVSFYNWEKPRRIIHDEISFIGNVAKGLFKAGLGPVQYHDVRASYYGCERYLGRIEQWVDGMTLLKALKKPDTDKEGMFRCLGTSLARFHAVIDNKEFKEDVIDYHFQKLEGSPLCYSLLEVWRRCAVIVTEKSGLRSSTAWSGFYYDFVAMPDVEELKKSIHSNLKSPFSAKMVHAHFDVNLSNAIVNDNTTPTQVTLIDIEWCGPSLAVYDFAKLISSLQIQIGRKEVNLTMAEVDGLMFQLVEAYLCTLGAFEGLEPGAAPRLQCINDFLADCRAFVPIACLVNVYSNLIHASFDNQLGEKVSEETVLGIRGTNFNWIRHASDHFYAFKRSLQMNSGQGRAEDTGAEGAQA